MTRTLNLPAMILAPDYSLTASSTPAVLHPGGTAGVIIRADGLRGMTDPILLSLEGAPLACFTASSRRASCRAPPARWC